MFGVACWGFLCENVLVVGAATEIRSMAFATVAALGILVSGFLAGFS